MTVQEALKVLDQVCKERQGNREDHMVMLQAIQMVTPEAEPVAEPVTEPTMETQKSDDNK